jgi:DNA-binding MarR family transcriptional regulator
MDDNAPTMGFLLHDVARLLRKRFEQHARGFGLTRSQWQVLAYLSQNEGIRQGGLAELLDIQPITLARLVDRLQEMRLVERRPDPKDRRVWLLRLTPDAHLKLVQARKLGDITRGEALSSVPEAERKRFLATLQILKDNLTAACERPPRDGTEDK